MFKPICRFLILALLPLAGGPVVAQSDTDPLATAEEMVARETLRSAVEQAIERPLAPASSGAMKVDNFVGAADDLERLGADAVPYLSVELDQALIGSYFICAYALGRIGGADAEKALRQAVANAERDSGEFAMDRKAWAVYGLAIMGVADAVDLLYQGQHLVGPKAIHRGFSLVEVAALLTAPKSAPRLFAIQSRLADDPEMLAQRIQLMRSFWRIPDPAIAPNLLELLTDDSEHIRREAIHALAFIPTPEAQAALIAALDDESPAIRLMAVKSLEWSESPIDPTVIAKKLESENDTKVRLRYYRLLANRMGPAALPVLTKNWGRPDGSDRTALVHSVQLSGASGSLPLLRQALADPEPRTVVWAVRALGTLENDEARTLLLQVLRSADWIAAQAAMEQLIGGSSDKAAPAIAKRLFEVELAGVMTDPRHRHRAGFLANALVQLDYTPALAQLREATARQTDLTLKASLERTIRQLEAIERCGSDTACWIEAVRSSDPDTRAVAYRFLARDGGIEGARALSTAFGRVEPEEGERILDALAASSALPSLELIERVLTGPAFDPADRTNLRNMAAWSARRIGGERMSRALRESASRRDGRDAAVLVYLGVLDGPDAVPVLERYRLPRLRYKSSSRGEELFQLDWLVRRIEAARSLAAFDVPPDKLPF